MSPQQLINRYLDHLMRPKKHLKGKIWNTYLIWQYTGFALGALVILVITFLKALSPLVISGVIIISILTSILLFKSIDITDRSYSLLIWARKGIYHYQILILASATVFLSLINEPILLYLDVLVIGLAVAQINGRIGCFKVGCCHGRPHAWGVCYGEEHLKAGYRNYLLGARLLPVQLLESIWLLFLIIIAMLFLINRNKPGEILAWYIIGYGAGRFFFEFLRADTDRLYFWGFSEAQWTTLILICLIAFMELSGILNFHLWHAGAAAFLLSAMTGIGLKRHFERSSKHLFLHPYHLSEVAGVVNWLLGFAPNGATISNNNFNPSGYYSGDTSLGLKISLSVNPGKTEDIYKYSLSCENKTMAAESAKALGNFIIQFRHSAGTYKEIVIDRGVVEIFISSSKRENARHSITRSG
jgi:prolipoprotein diacylglyceryltransferase